MNEVVSRPETRRVHSDMDGKAAIQYADDEICIIVSESARVALLTFFGKTSRDDMLARGLSHEQARIIEHFCGRLE
jgi:hypothetical protein